MRLVVVKVCFAFRLLSVVLAAIALVSCALFLVAVAARATLESGPEAAFVVVLQTSVVFF
jgi:hypothetical protein